MNLAKILVADDEQDIRTFTNRTLTHEGHTVTLAEDGELAIELLDENDYDLVILDIMMPNKNGLEVVEYMKNTERLRSVPIFLFSASGPIDNLTEVVEEMVDVYLRKPFRKTAFLQVVNKLLKIA
jgi:CheY-like chemotaxis protein